METWNHLSLHKGLTVHLVQSKMEPLGKGKHMTDDIELTSNEKTILKELYFAEQCGHTILNNHELTILTGLPLKAIKLATQQLEALGYIQWEQRAVH